MEDYSLSDIKAITEDNDGFGGGGAWLIIVLFLFLFGNNGFGFNNAKSAGAVEQEILSNQHFDALSAKIGDVANGICDSTYAVTNAVTTEGRALQTQLSQCCCENRLGQKDLATAIHAEGEATRNLIQANEIQTLRDKVADLQLAQSQCNQNAYLINAIHPCPIPAYPVCNPFCGCEKANRNG